MMSMGNMVTEVIEVTEPVAMATTSLHHAGQVGRLFGQEAAAEATTSRSTANVECTERETEIRNLENH